MARAQNKNTKKSKKLAVWKILKFFVLFLILLFFIWWFRTLLLGGDLKFLQTKLYNPKENIEKTKIDSVKNLSNEKNKNDEMDKNFLDATLMEDKINSLMDNRGYLQREIDGDKTNELNNKFYLLGQKLIVEDAGGKLKVDLSDYIIKNKSIGDLENVDTENNLPIVGQVLAWDGDNWVPENSAVHTGQGGSIFFADSSGGRPTEDNNNLFWDDTNKRLGLDTNTPRELLDIVGNVRLDGKFLDKDGDEGNNGQVLSSTETGTDWVDVSTDPVPFISGIVPDHSAGGVTIDLVINGYNFTPNSAVAISGGNIINSVNIISPVKMIVNVTTTTVTGFYDMEISNNGVLNTEWVGNGVGIFAISNSDGTSQTTAGESCKSILDDGYSTGDGTYWINPDGGSTANAFQVYCDMATDGGGWTRINYAADLSHQAHFSGGDANRWLTNDFSLVLSDQQINDIRAVSTEGKQTYHGTCQGVIHYLYQTNNYAYAFGFRFHNGHETAFNQQTYPSTNITVPYDGCKINNNTMAYTDFEINDIRVPVINVHSRDNSSTEEFGSPLTSYPAWLR